MSTQILVPEVTVKRAEELLRLASERGVRSLHDEILRTADELRRAVEQ